MNVESKLSCRACAPKAGFEKGRSWSRSQVVSRELEIASPRQKLAILATRDRCWNRQTVKSRGRVGVFGGLDFRRKRGGLEPLLVEIPLFFFLFWSCLGTVWAWVKMACAAARSPADQDRWVRREEEARGKLAGAAAPSAAARKARRGSSARTPGLASLRPAAPACSQGP